MTSTPSNSSLLSFLSFFPPLGVALFSASRGWILICVLSCRLGSRRLLFGALPQALFLSQGVYALWTREVSWFSSSWLLRLFLFACLYGKRLVTTRFELKILMSTIISLGVFYRDLLSLFSPLVGDVYFGLLLLMRFSLSCLFPVLEIFVFS